MKIMVISEAEAIEVAGVINRAIMDVQGSQKINTVTQIAIVDHLCGLRNSVEIISQEANG